MQRQSLTEDRTRGNRNTPGLEHRMSQRRGNKHVEVCTKRIKALHANEQRFVHEASLLWRCRGRDCCCPFATLPVMMLHFELMRIMYAGDWLKVRLEHAIRALTQTQTQTETQTETDTER